MYFIIMLFKINIVNLWRWWNTPSTKSDYPQTREATALRQHGCLSMWFSELVGNSARGDQAVIVVLLRKQPNNTLVVTSHNTTTIFTVTGQRGDLYFGKRFLLFYNTAWYMYLSLRMWTIKNNDNQTRHFLSLARTLLFFLIETPPT